MNIASNDNFCFYVYVWRDLHGVPFYVGKGKNKRAYDTYDRSDDFTAIHDNGGCTVEIVDSFIHEAQALAFEMELIALYGRRDFGGTLVNKTDGGDGCLGHIKTPESIAQWRLKNVGRKRAPEVGRRISASKTGYKHTEEALAKIRDANSKRLWSPEARAKASLIASNPSVETRAKMSIAGKARMSDPAVRQALSEAITGKTHTLDTRRRISASTTGVPKSEATVVNMRNASRMKPPRGLHKGVRKSGNRFRSIIAINGRSQNLGFYATAEEAATAYDAAAMAAWGYGNCYVNFPSAGNDNGRLVQLTA